VLLAVFDKAGDQRIEDCLVAQINRRHELHLAIDELPPLPLLAGGEELLPTDARPGPHRSTFLNRLSQK